MSLVATGKTVVTKAKQLSTTRALAKNFEAPKPGQMRVGTKITIDVDGKPTTFTAAKQGDVFGFIDDASKSFTKLDEALPALRQEAGGLYRFDDAAQSKLVEEARQEINVNKDLSVQKRVQALNQLDENAKQLQLQRNTSQAGRAAVRNNKAIVAVKRGGITVTKGNARLVTPGAPGVGGGAGGAMVDGAPANLDPSLLKAIDNTPPTLTQGAAGQLGNQLGNSALAAAKASANGVQRGRNALRRNAIFQRPPNKPPPTTTEIRTATNEVLAANAATAHSKGTISQRVFNILKNNMGKVAFATVLVGSGVLNVVQGKTIDDLEDELTDVQLAHAANEHMKDRNGCYLIDRSKNYTKTKVKLLTCGHFDVAGALETCTTQSYAAGKTLSECPTNTFNPCAKGSTNREGTGPLVPDACSTYLYKDTAPPAVAGVTVKDACETTDGKALDEKQACSVYCKTENFELPPMMDLVCEDMDYPTAFVDLMDQLGIPPEEVYPPVNPPPPAAMTFSKPLLITTGVTAGLFLILGVIYLLKRKPKPF